MRARLIAIVCGLSSVLAAQSVQLYNTSNPGASDFQVGDQWELDIAGAPNQLVQVTTTFNDQNLGSQNYGYTDQYGMKTLTGYMPESAVGHWTEAWSVGGSPASPTLDFWVNEATFGGCETFASAAPPFLYSTDFYSLTELIFISPGSTFVEGQIVSGACGIVDVEFVALGYPAYLGANLTNYGASAFGTVYDNENTGAYGLSGRCYECYYPIIQTGVVDFVAADAAFNTYFFQTSVVLYIDREDI